MISLSAQDVIITNDSKKIDAKIIEVSKSEIKYKEMDNLEGPTFILGTDEISSIIYASGKVSVFNNQKEEKSAPSEDRFMYNNTIISEFGTNEHEIVKRDDYYYLGKVKMNENEYLDYIQHNCPDAWYSYQKGCSLWRTGWGLLGPGIGLFLAGSILMPLGAASYDARLFSDGGKGLLIAGSVIFAVGGAFMTASIPCLIVGGIKRNTSHKVYNESCAERQMAVTFGIQVSPSGLGVAMNF